MIKGKKLTVVNTCEFCNVDFNPCKFNQKCCSDSCSKKLYAKKLQEVKKASYPKFINCKYCLKSFDVTLNERPNKCKFCSRQCCFDWHKQVKREKTQEKQVLEERYCDYCGDNFEFIKYKIKRFCSDYCGSEFYKRQLREESQIKRNTTEVKCPVCDNIFVPQTTMKQKYCSDKCKNMFRKKIYKSLRTIFLSFNSRKTNKSIEMMGYNSDELREHIKSHPNWKNINLDETWHLDHIFPIKAFVDKGIKDIALINSLNNLQPLSEFDNCSKGDTYDKDEFDKWLKINAPYLNMEHLQ